MPLTLEQTKHLIRLQMTAEELLASVRAHSGPNLSPLRALGGQLNAVIVSVREELEGVDPSLAARFDREVGGQFEDVYGAEAKASALVGWLKGLTTAEQVEAQIAKNAEAYAEARIREERGVGFKAPGA